MQKRILKLFGVTLSHAWNRCIYLYWEVQKLIHYPYVALKATKIVIKAIRMVQKMGSPPKKTSCPTVCSKTTSAFVWFVPNWPALLLVAEPNICIRFQPKKKVLVLIVFLKPWQHKHNLVQIWLVARRPFFWNRPYRLLVRNIRQSCSIWRRTS